MQSHPRYRLYLKAPGISETVPAVTLDGALAVAKAFEIKHAGNRDAYTQVWDREQAAKPVYSRWMGEAFGPKDTRHPAEKLFRKAVRSGARVVLVDDLGTWEINAAAPVRLAA